MRTRIGAALRAAAMVTAVIVAACAKSGFESAQNAPLDTDDQKASYAIGLQVGGSLAPIESHVSMDAFVRGLQDAMAQRDPAIEAAALQEVMQRFSQTVADEQQKQMAEQGQANESAGSVFLEQNAAKDGVTTTESGLQYEVLEAGDGPKPGPDDQVTINYRGTLVDGTQFDSSYDRGEPSTFRVGGVIAGFSEALQLMPVGSKYRFVIPGKLAYGEQGSPPNIGPNATLIFEIELVSIAE